MTRNASEITAQDPVCGMDVEMRAAKHSSEYRGRIYYFCSLMCPKTFEDDPGRYLQLHPQSSV